MQLFGTKEQKSLHCPRTKGQRDKLKILPRDEMEQDILQAVTAKSLSIMYIKWAIFSYDFLFENNVLEHLSLFLAWEINKNVYCVTVKRVRLLAKSQHLTKRMKEEASHIFSTAGAHHKFALPLFW